MKPRLICPKYNLLCSKHNFSVYFRETELILFPKFLLRLSRLGMRYVFLLPPIRIFPIALPLKQDNGIERVFNGYKKKYIDKVLLEFITR